MTEQEWLEKMCSAKTHRELSAIIDLMPDITIRKYAVQCREARIRLIKTLNRFFDEGEME